MRYLEVRRHSFTKKGDERGRSSHLSQEGVAAARAVGKGLAPIAYVGASEAPRTVESAVAMGFAVDEVLALGAAYMNSGIELHEQWSWPEPYLRYQELIETGGPLAKAAEAELEIWRSALRNVDDEEVALLVGHGGSIEATLVAALPHGDVTSWGPPFSHLDGVRVAFDEDGWRLVEFHRQFASPR